MNISNKISWYKSLCDKIAYQNLLKEEAEKCSRIKNYKPKIKISKKNQELFKQYIEDAKEEKIRKERRKRKEAKKETDRS